MVAGVVAVVIRCAWSIMQGELTYVIIYYVFVTVFLILFRIE